jgi:hypothetical protein
MAKEAQDKFLSPANKNLDHFHGKKPDHDQYSFKRS